MSDLDSFAAPAEPLPEFLVLLGLRPPVSVEDVKQAYLDKAKTAHPDRGGNAQQFVKLQEAFEQATEYAQFKAGRMKWLSGWVEQYAEQQQLVDEIRSLGGEVKVESVDWLARTIGDDFATVLERIMAVRLEGPAINDSTLAHLAEMRRLLATLRSLELIRTNVSPRGLAYVHQYDNLRHIDLSGTKTSLRAVELLLRDLKQLESIGLSGSGLGLWARLKLWLRYHGVKFTF
jgi:hypothetical protein